MLEVRHLQALDAVVADGSFAGAAASLGYSQSTLSQQIATLEKTVGGRVFDRFGGPRRAELTPLGRLVLTHGRKVLEAVRATASEVERFKAGSGRVDIGTFQTVTNVLLPEVIRRLRDRHPDCELRLFEEETELPQLDGLDVMFFDGPASDGLDATPVVRDAHVVLARTGSLPAGPVAIRQLHQVDVVALPPICDQRRVEAFLSEACVVPRTVFRTADNAAIVQMVTAGLGWAIMPWLAVSPTMTNSVTAHPITPAPPHRDIHALTRGTPSPLARAVIELTRQSARRIAQRAPSGFVVAED